jgi:hypothetical protein
VRERTVGPYDPQAAGGHAQRVEGGAERIERTLHVCGPAGLLGELGSL